MSITVSSAGNLSSLRTVYLTLRQGDTPDGETNKTNTPPQKVQRGDGLRIEPSAVTTWPRGVSRSIIELHRS